MAVTPQKEEFMKKYLANERTILSKKNVKLPWIVEDNILSEWFKHTIISHFVWIYKGKVVAITGKDPVTAKNICAILDGKDIKLPVKRDLINFNFNDPFFDVKINQGNNDSDLLMYSAIRGYIDGIDPSGKFISIDSVNKTIRLHFANKSIFKIYNIALRKINPALPWPAKSRIIWEVENPSKYEYLKAYDRVKMGEWRPNNAITYESLLPIETGGKGAYKKLISDLDHFFGLQGRWEKRKVPCLVIVKVETDQEIKRKKEQAKKHPYYDFNGIAHNGIGERKNDGFILRREINMRYLIMGKANRFDKPLVDESHYKGTFIFPKYMYKKGEFMYEKKDLESFQKGLQECGFKLIEKECKVDMFIFTEIR